MMENKKQRIKLNKDNSTICKYSVDDIVIVLFNKYGKHKYIAKVLEISENMHSLDGVWVSVLPLKAIDPYDKTAVEIVNRKIALMVPLKDIKGIAN